MEPMEGWQWQQDTFAENSFVRHGIVRSSKLSSYPSGLRPLSRLVLFMGLLMLYLVQLLMGTEWVRLCTSL